MRRKDREVQDDGYIDEIIRSCDCCRLGFADGDEAYIVPMNFGFDSQGGRRTFYFHSARQGRKLDLIEKTGRASFELDGNHLVKPGEMACDYEFRFRCVMGVGDISIVQDEAERAAGLQMVMEQCSGRSDWTFNPASMKAVAVLRLDVTAISCKEHL